MNENAASRRKSTNGFSLTDIKSLLPEEITDRMLAYGLPPFRAKQIFSWLSKGCGSFEEMTNLPMAIRRLLAKEFEIYAPSVIRHQVSHEDGTQKFLWEFSDGYAVETVLMCNHYGNTVCISTQVGCRQGCAFCASAIGGLVRNLTAGEMLDEVLFTEKESGLPVSHVVLMGIGEPLDNFDSVSRFLQLIHHPEGRNISFRNISLSTCGLIERFDELAKMELPITLSISLHAPDDETRSQIMPANRGRGVDALFSACKKYFDVTGRRISFEYVLIDGVTDSREQAELLACRVKPLGAHVNLIPLNHVEERHFRPSTEENVKVFRSVLEKFGVNATVRRKLGSDVEASCGQLRRKTLRNKS